MEARVLVQTPSDYRRWVSSQAQPQLGQSEWNGVCAKCHGFKGQGGYGPAIATSTLLTSASSLRTILFHGQNRLKPLANYMPPVGRDWTDKQFQALMAYIKANIVKGGAGGGG